MAALGTVRGGEGEARSTAPRSLDGENWSELLSVLQEGVVAYDEQSGNISDANHEACRLFGCTRDELLNLNFQALFLGREGSMPSPSACSEVRRSKRTDGSSFWSEVRTARSRSMSGVVIALIRDVTGLQERLDASRITDELYRSLVRNLPKSAIIVCDHTLRFVLVDGPEVLATGFSKEGMEGKTIHEALPPEFVVLVEANMRRVLAGESFSAEIPFQDLWYTYNYVPIFDEGGRVLYGMILALNVTERRRVEAALKKSEERFVRIFRSSPDAMCVTRADDSTIIEVNPSFERMFGWDASIVGKTASELGFLASHEERDSLLKSFHETGSIDAIERNVSCRDGRILAAELSMRAIELDGQECVLSIARDTSERQKARRALEANETRLRGLSEATFEGIGISERGQIVDADDQLALMFGLKPSELIGQPVSTLVAPESLAEVRARMESGSEEPYEHLSVRPDGSRFPVEVRTRMAMVHGRRLRFAAVRDITARKKAELERESLIAELRARNAEMEQFTYTVSHDLKSPLITISGFLGMLERDLQAGDDARVRTDIARIGSAASKMMRLLGDLLELSRVGRVTHPKERVALKEVVQESLELVAGALAARNVSVRVAPDLPHVHADRLRLVQVVQNLLENAVKYFGDAERPSIEIGHHETEADVVCYVKDNGIGIDPRFSERIFGLFEKLDPRSDGTGLGLALVRRIMDFHGGRVWAESDGKTGSTFFFSLPRRTTEPQSKEAGGGQS